MGNGNLAGLKAALGGSELPSGSRTLTWALCPPQGPQILSLCLPPALTLACDWSSKGANQFRVKRARFQQAQGGGLKDAFCLEPSSCSRRSRVDPRGLKSSEASEAEAGGTRVWGGKTVTTFWLLASQWVKACTVVVRWAMPTGTVLSPSSWGRICITRAEQELEKVERIHGKLRPGSVREETG